MMESFGKVTSIVEDSYDDQIQNISITFDSGAVVKQSVFWPAGQYGDADAFNLYDSLYKSSEFTDLCALSPDLALGIISQCTKLVDGTDLKLSSVGLESFIGGKVEITEPRVLHDNWFQVVQMSLRHSLWEGGWSERKEHTFIKGREGVACVLYDKERDAIVLIEEFRIGAVFDDQPWMVGIPTGGLEEGEDPEVGAKREAMEEAGLTPYYMEHMSTYKPTPGFTTHTQHLYYGLVDTKDLKTKISGLDSEGEDIRVEVVDVSEVNYQLRNKVLTNGTAITALLQFLMYHYQDARNVEVS